MTARDVAKRLACWHGLTLNRDKHNLVTVSKERADGRYFVAAFQGDQEAIEFMQNQQPRIRAGLPPVWDIDQEI